jgi:hypothetical protein
LIYEVLPVGPPAHATVEYPIDDGMRPIARSSQPWAFSVTVDLIGATREIPSTGCPEWFKHLSRALRKHVPALLSFVAPRPETRPKQIHSAAIQIPRPPTLDATIPLTERLYYTSTGDGFELCLYEDENEDEKQTSKFREKRAELYLSWLLTLLFELRSRKLDVRCAASYGQQAITRIQVGGGVWAGAVATSVPMPPPLAADKAPADVHAWTYHALKQKLHISNPDGSVLLLGGELATLKTLDDCSLAVNQEIDGAWIVTKAPFDAPSIARCLSLYRSGRTDRHGGNSPGARLGEEEYFDRLIEKIDKRIENVFGGNLAEVCKHSAPSVLHESLRRAQRHNGLRALLETSLSAAVGVSLAGGKVRALFDSPIITGLLVIGLGAVAAVAFAAVARHAYGTYIYARFAPCLHRFHFSDQRLDVREYIERGRIALCFAGSGLGSVARRKVGILGSLFWSQHDIGDDSDLDEPSRESPVATSDLRKTEPSTSAVLRELPSKHLKTPRGIVLSWIVAGSGIALYVLTAWLLERGWIPGAARALAAACALGLCWNVCLYLRLRKISLSLFSLRRRDVDDVKNANRAGGYLDFVNACTHLGAAVSLGIALAPGIASDRPLWAIAGLGLAIAVASGWHSMRHLATLRKMYEEIAQGRKPYETAMTDALHIQVRTLVVRQEVLDLAMDCCFRNREVYGRAVASFVSDQYGDLLSHSEVAESAPEQNAGLARRRRPQTTQPAAAFYADGRYAAKIIGDLVRYARGCWVLLAVPGRFVGGNPAEDGFIEASVYRLHVTAIAVRESPTGYLGLAVPTEPTRTLRFVAHEAPATCKRAPWYSSTEVKRGAAVVTASPQALPASPQADAGCRVAI